MDALGLDWKLLLAQIVNFGILLFLLKKILYKPLIKSIDERNKKINSAVENSLKIEDKLKGVEQKEDQILEKARQRAKSEREELIVLAESEKEKIINEAKVSAQKEVKKGLDSIKSAENDAVKNLTDKFMAEVTEKLDQKLRTEAKIKKFPAMKKFIS